MGLVRIGSAAVDPETIARIEDAANDPSFGHQGIIVTFRDGRQATFHRKDADAFRKFVANLPDGIPLAGEIGFKPPPPQAPPPPPGP